MKHLRLAILTITSILFFAFKQSNIGDSNTLTSLFKIERSKDNNQIFYDVNLNKSGDFDKNNPINIYWIKNTEGGKVKPLTWIQKKYAYGLKFLNINDDFVSFRFVSSKHMYFTLTKTKDSNYQVFTKYKNQLLNVKRIYIKIDGGTFWFPNITAVEVYAKNMETGKEVIEIITP